MTRDPIKRAAEKRRYYERYRDRLIAKQRAYHEKNRDAVNARRRAERRDNPEKARAKEKAFRERNRESHLLRKRARHERNRGTENDYMRKRHKFRRYGVTPEQYQAMVDKQAGLCAICKSLPDERGLFVDHDHVTGKLRDLLCSRCNSGLGMAKENPAILRAMIEYLEAHNVSA